jgi:hypothetical protein
LVLWKREGPDPYRYTPVTSGLSEVESPVVSLDFSPDGALLAAACEDGRLLIWDLQSGQPAGTSQAFPRGTLTSVRFGPDSREIGVATTKGVVYICNLTKDFSEVAFGPWVIHRASEGRFVNRVVFRPGVRHSRFVTAALEGLKIWDFHATPIVELLHIQGPAFDVDWDASGDTLAAAGVPDRVVLFRDPSPKGGYHDERALAYSLLTRYRWSETVKGQVLPDLESSRDAPPEAVRKGAARLLDAFGDDPAAMAAEALTLLATPEPGRTAEVRRLAERAHSAWVKDYPLLDHGPSRPDLGAILVILGAAIYRDQAKEPRHNDAAPPAEDARKRSKEQQDAINTAVQALTSARKHLEKGSTDDLRALAYLTMVQSCLPDTKGARQSFDEYESLLRDQKVQNFEFESLRREAGLAVFKDRHLP